MVDDAVNIGFLMSPLYATAMNPLTTADPAWQNARICQGSWESTLPIRLHRVPQAE